MNLVFAEQVDLSQYTTLRVGGVADYLVEVTNKNELKEALTFAKEKTKTRPLILGGGSNLLIPDEGYRGLVIRMKSSGITFSETGNETVLVTATAGEGWDDLVNETTKKGLSGLERLSGIPGTVGAAPVQNINAYGASASDTIDTVAVFDTVTDSVRILSQEECRLGYRDSIFKQIAGKDLIVLSVTFKLSKHIQNETAYRSASQSIERYLLEQNISDPNPADVRKAVLHIRSKIGMLEGQFRSAGSFFKNTTVSPEKFNYILDVVEKNFSVLGKKLMPWHWTLPSGEVKVSTAFLMECSPYNKQTCDVTKTKNPVGLSPLHSLSIVTKENATTNDVKKFVKEIQNTLRNIFAVTIETEVIFIKNNS